MNFLLIESLLRFYMFYGDSFKVECPTGSGDFMHLGHVAEELQHRLQHIFARDDDGTRACNAGNNMLNHSPNWTDHVFFHEFFHGDTGAGLGASHQTGWTGLIAKMIHDSGVNCRLPHTPRTPGAAASHYFDDVLSRTVKSPRPFLGRRSSTSRSIDARSDWNEELEKEEREEKEREERERKEDDEQVLEIVNRKLKRVLSFNEGKNGTGGEDEDDFEAQLDER